MHYHPRHPFICELDSTRVALLGWSVRVLPDVLSDFIVEQRCLNSVGRPTGYAEAVYASFGSHALKDLMRNLSELDLATRPE